MPAPVLDALSSFGFSGICNVLAAIKVARYQGLGEGDVVAAAGIELRVMATPGHSSDSLSFVLDDAVLTDGEFRDAALKVAASLRARGVSPGDRVGLAAILPRPPGAS